MHQVGVNVLVITFSGCILLWISGEWAVKNMTNIALYEQNKDKLEIRRGLLLLIYHLCVISALSSPYLKALAMLPQSHPNFPLIFKYLLHTRQQ